MWKCNIESPDIEIEESLKGFIQVVEELIASKCTEKAQEPSN